MYASVFTVAFTAMLHCLLCSKGRPALWCHRQESTYVRKTTEMSWLEITQTVEMMCNKFHKRMFAHMKNILLRSSILRGVESGFLADW